MKRALSSEAKRLRGSAGDKQRMRRLKAHGYHCSRCNRLGAHRKASASASLPLLIVDHIKPLALGGEDVDSNVRVVCQPCHDVLTAEQFGHERKAGIGACDIDGMPTDPAHPWNR